MTTIEFATEREGWNVYRLEDGTILKIRLVLADVKCDGNNPDGSPKYQLTWQTAMHVEPTTSIRVPING